MKWNREVNPIAVGVISLIASLLVIDQSLRLAFRPVGRASAESVALAEYIKAELPTDNLSERLTAIKMRIAELEAQKTSLETGLPAQSGSARVSSVQNIGELNRVLEILREEETETINDIASSPNQ
jgi:hypothetical protein